MSDTPTTGGEAEPLQDCRGCGGSGNCANGEPCACLYRFEVPRFTASQLTDLRSGDMNILIENEVFSEDGAAEWRLMHTQIDRIGYQGMTASVVVIMEHIECELDPNIECVKLWCFPYDMAIGKHCEDDDTQLIAGVEVEIRHITRSAYVLPERVDGEHVIQAIGPQLD